MTIKPRHLVGIAGVACMAIAAAADACPEKELSTTKRVKLVQGTTGAAKTICCGTTKGAVRLTAAENSQAVRTIVCDGETLTTNSVVGSFGEPIAVSFAQNDNIAFGKNDNIAFGENGNIAFGDGEYAYSVIKSTTNIDGQDKTIIVRIENGEVYVEVDGQEIDAKHIKHGKTKITVLGDDGNVIAVMPMRIGGRGGWAPDAGTKFEFIVNDGKFETTRGFFFDEQDHPRVMVGINMGDAEFEWDEVPFDPDQAFVILNAIKGLPAARAGLRSNDLVIEIDGGRPATPKMLMEILSGKEPGDNVEFMVLRKGKERKFLFELAPYDAHKLGVIAAPQPPRTPEWTNTRDNQITLRIDSEKLALELARDALSRAERLREGHVLDVERAQLLIEEMIRRQESIQRQLVRQDNQQFFVRPDGRTNELENRVDRIERQLDRVEDKLDRILDKLDR